MTTALKRIPDTSFCWCGEFNHDWWHGGYTALDWVKLHSLIGEKNATIRRLLKAVVELEGEP